MTIEYVWSTLRDDLIERWSDRPNGPLEQRILDVWERHPQLVLDASEQITERYERGIVRSPWAVLVKHVEQAAAAAERSDRPAQGERDKAKARAQAEQWIRAAGVHFDAEHELEDELFGDRGLLRAYGDDSELRDSMLALWHRHRPAIERVEQEAEAERLQLLTRRAERELDAELLASAASAPSPLNPFIEDE
jgi:hypothetical protein